MIQQASAQPTLLFIPDISGFTQFVKQTEISHSQHIIEELLETLIDSNEIGLEVSEIEGDAILFYRFGQSPTAAELLAQIRQMYVQFHGHLKLYETQRICQCGACGSANRLRLKFVAHFGEVAEKHVKEHSKLFGEDVITAHRLLKNGVQLPEYALLTEDLMSAGSGVEIDHETWSPLQEGRDAYDIGTIDYCFVPLEPLLPEVPEPRIEDYDLSGPTVEILSVEQIIEAPLDQVFNVLSDLSIRHEWMLGLVDSSELNGKITKNGSTHRCVMKGTDKDPFFVSHGFQYREDMITFTDTNQREGFAAVYALFKMGDGQTRLKMHYLIKQNAFKEFIIKTIMKKKLVRDSTANLNSLNEYCKRLMLQGTDHPAQIVLKPSS